MDYAKFKIISRNKGYPVYHSRDYHDYSNGWFIYLLRSTIYCFIFSNFSILGVRFIALYLAIFLLNQFRKISICEQIKFSEATHKETISSSKENNQLLSKHGQTEGFNKYEGNKLKNSSLSEVPYNCGICYLEAIVKMERSLLNFAHRIRCYREILQILGQTCKVSRVYAFENNFSADGDLMMSFQAEWCAEGIPAKSDRHPWENLSYTQFFPRWLKLLARGDIVLEIVGELSETERKILGLQGIVSILIAPIIAKGKFVGFLGFDNCVEPETWEAKEIAFLQAATGMLSLAHEHLLADNALQTMILKTKDCASQLENIVQERTVELHREIAERKRIQTELEKSLSLQCATLESTADGILVVDSQGNIAGFNQKFLQMWRIPEPLMASGNYRKALRLAMRELEAPKQYLTTIRELHIKPDTVSYYY